MCGVQLKDRRSTDLMFMLGFNGTMDHLAMAESVHLVWSCVVKGGWSSFLEWHCGFQLKVNGSVSLTRDLTDIVRV